MCLFLIKNRPKIHNLVTVASTHIIDYREGLIILALGRRWMPMQITRCVAAVSELVFLNPDHHHHHWHPKALMFHLVRIFVLVFLVRLGNRSDYSNIVEHKPEYSFMSQSFCKNIWIALWSFIEKINKHSLSLFLESLMWGGPFCKKLPNSLHAL